MKRFGWVVVQTLVLVACAATPPEPPAPPVPQPTWVTPSESGATITSRKFTLRADRLIETVRGNTFFAPAQWTVSRQGDFILLEAPEPGSRIALTDVQADDAQRAIASAWKQFDPTMQRAVSAVLPAGPVDGWTRRTRIEYLTSPNEHRVVEAFARFANGLWTVALLDMASDVAEKRAGQMGVLFGRLLPKGFTRESFAGKQAHALTPERVAALTAFVDKAMVETKVPGVAFGLIQNGRVVFSGGRGVRALGNPAPVDAQTSFLIASNTKGLVTLLLAKEVDEGRFTWDTPATQILPTFRLADAQVTSQVAIKHLICACTGMPRRDMEWLFEYGAATPESALSTLATMSPTSEFGKLYQYSNPMAAAAGFLAGHALYPQMGLGQAYDRAMQEKVFNPLGMRRTTHDFEVAESGNAAKPHSPNAEGLMVAATGAVNRSVVFIRPAGGAWSTIEDMLKYVAMELKEGVLEDGTRLVSREALLARRAPQVNIGAGITYGMGLMVNQVYGTPVVHHGGDMIGFHSDMIWLPEHGVGAVVLTNGDPGWLIRNSFRRKLLEVLFDGRAEADESVTAGAAAFYRTLNAERQRLQIPAEPSVAAGLASLYANAGIGKIAVLKKGAALWFDFGEWSSEVASRTNPDGTTSWVTIAPGIAGMEFVSGLRNGLRTLTLRDGQHVYEAVEVKER